MTNFLYMETLWLRAREVGTILGISKRAVHKRAAGWRFRVTKGRGGERSFTD
jgi:hypothetical protein